MPYASIMYMLTYYKISIPLITLTTLALISSQALEDTTETPIHTGILLDAVGSPDYELNSEVLKNMIYEFEIVNLPIHRHQLFDIGITDINQDGLLDVYTSNCNFKPSFLINQGNFIFQNAINNINLHLLPNFPGFACSISPPIIENKGLYIYYIWGNINFRYIKLPPIEKVNIKLKIPHNLVSISQGANEKVTISKYENSSEVNLSLDDGDYISVDVIAPSIPVDFQIDTAMPLENIYIGADKTNPPDHKFTLNTIDRHSCAWADINQDGAIDTFIGRGGLRGNKEFEYIRKNLLQDQLFINQFPLNKILKFENVYPISGLKNCECGTRKACWIDIDNDCIPELFIICTRDEPCHLFKKYSDKYEECTLEYKLDIIGEVPYFWFDFNNDSFLDLLTFSNGKLSIYENLNGKQFKKHMPELSIGEINPIFLLANDLDNDHNLEFILANKNTYRTHLLKHITSFQFEELSPEEIGIPNTSYWCAWADLDNDSYDELISIPDGIYKKNLETNKYEKCELLKLPHLKPENFSDARVEVFDANNDGKLDIILGYREKSFTNLSGYGEWWHISLLKNISSNSGNWIQLDSTFPAFEPTIGFGDKIFLKTKCGKEYLRIVGQFENSRGNQGHYRIYFGLGSEQPYQLILQIRGKRETKIDMSDINKLHSINQLLNSISNTLTQ